MPKRFVPEESKVRELVLNVDAAVARAEQHHREIGGKLAGETHTWAGLCDVVDHGRRLDVESQDVKDALQAYLAGPRRHRKSRGKRKVAEAKPVPAAGPPDA